MLFFFEDVDLVLRVSFSCCKYATSCDSRPLFFCKPALYAQDCRFQTRDVFCAMVKLESARFPVNDAQNMSICCSSLSCKLQRG